MRRAAKLESLLKAAKPGCQVVINAEKVCVCVCETEGERERGPFLTCPRACRSLVEERWVQLETCSLIRGVRWNGWALCSHARGASR